MRTALAASFALACGCSACSLLAACGHADEGTRAATQPSVRAELTLKPQSASATSATNTLRSSRSAVATERTASTASDGSSSTASLRPPIHEWPIPFPRARKQQMAAYSLRHYGEDTYVLSDPRVIVEHYTETTTAQEAYDTFAPDVPDSEFHELPNTCAHFLVERSGRIDQLVPLSLRCRHTVGLNWTAIGVENVGFSDREILDDRAQMNASLQLTRWLRCTYGIALKDVIGHNESLSSPYHRERVPAFQHQTHSDWNHADMHVYRMRLARLPCPDAAGTVAPTG